MNRQSLYLLIPCTLSAVLLSLPWLLPHCGAFALVGFVPLLIADAVATQCRLKRFWLLHYYTFVLWNALTTFWVCNATLGGGIFAVLANALQMSVVWGVFRFSKRYFKGPLPYLFLAAMWIAWERKYFSVDISWPWLTLGNAFAQSTGSIQWYAFTGTLGGSLWIWAVNLSFFGMIAALSDGGWHRWNNVARAAAVTGVVLVTAGPVVLSKAIYNSYDERSEGSLKVMVAQPSFDPYEKLEHVPQSEQTATLVSLFEKGFAQHPSDSTGYLLMGPETFTSDVILNDVWASPTVRSLTAMLDGHKGNALLFGAASHEFHSSAAPPSPLARKSGDSWVTAHNVAMLFDGSQTTQIYRKSKLVVGTELTPYPKIFVPLDEWLAPKFGMYSLMGRDEGQKEVTLLNYGGVPFGSVVCYESIYGEYCTEYVRKGAKFLAVITNDAWWGDTPGYRQHLSYSCLRAIETRRDIARCANTGISGFINQRGELVDSCAWWEKTVMSGEVNLNSEQTFFVRNGDITGRVSTLVFLLFAALLVVKAVLARFSKR